MPSHLISESADNDQDGTGNNADTDDDNDGYADITEANSGTDPETGPIMGARSLSIKVGTPAARMRRHVVIGGRLMDLIDLRQSDGG